MILEARDISFRYDNGNRRILNRVSLRLESGEGGPIRSQRVRKDHLLQDFSGI